MRREDHLGGLAVKGLVVADAVAAAGALEARPFDPFEQAQPAAEAVGGDPGLRVLGRLLRVLDHERLDRRSQKTRADGRSADADDVGQVELAFAQLADHGAAEVRVLDRGRRYIAGVELVGRSLVVSLLVGHRPHQCDVFHDLGRVVPALGDRNPGNGRRDGLGLAAVLGAGLGIERFELAGAAGHPEQDARHLALAQIGGMERHPVGES